MYYKVGGMYYTVGDMYYTVGGVYYTVGGVYYTVRGVYYKVSGVYNTVGGVYYTSLHQLTHGQPEHRPGTTGTPVLISGLVPFFVHIFPASVLSRLPGPTLVPGVFSNILCSSAFIQRTTV